MTNDAAIVENETETATDTSLQPRPAKCGSLSHRQRAGLSRRSPTKAEVRGKRVSELSSEADLEPETLNLEPRSARRHGKVARLPLDARTTVNAMLDDGKPYPDIIAKLAELGHPGFLVQNISRWKLGGYKDWLEEKRDRQETKTFAESALQLIRELKHPGDLCEANQILAATQLWRALMKFQKCDASQLIGDLSTRFIQIIRASTHQLSAQTRRERMKSDLQHRETKAAQQNQPKTPASTTEPNTEAVRQMVFHFVEDALGIKPIDPESPDAIDYGGCNLPNPNAHGARLSPPAETSEPASAPRSSPGADSDSPSPGLSAIASATAEGEGRGEGGLSALAASPEPADAVQPLSSSEISNLKSEITSSAATSNAAASTPDLVNLKSKIVNPPMLPNPFFPSLNPQPSTLNCFPLSPLAPTPPERTQPHGHVPIFDRFSALYGWIPQDGPGSYPTFPDPVGFNNRRGETLCWIYPADYYPEGVSPPNPRQVPVLTSDGVITEWLAGEPDILRRPSRTAIDLYSRRHRTIIAWVDDRQPPYDPPCGALVADF